MKNTQKLNTKLYEKMYEAQERYRSWLLSKPPEEILNYAYEYTLREDILLSLESHDLTAEQASALLRSRDPLADIFRDFEKQETDHMTDIWNTVEARANNEVEKLRERAKQHSAQEMAR